MVHVKEVSNQEKLKTLPCDEAFYYKHEGGQLVGMVIKHVHDLQIAGINHPLRSLEEKLDKLLTVSKVERDTFPFTGIDVEKVADRIVLSMEEYIQSIEEIAEIRKVKKDMPLTETEMKLFRKYIGKLNWLCKIQGWI